MAASADLRELASAKSALRLRIACRRIRCTDAIVHAARPLIWLDEARAAQRRLAPLFAACRRRRPKRGILSIVRVIRRLVRRVFASTSPLH